ncbi:MAG: hypothetical protein KC708_11620 [Anaerolineae bacterium]|nr:hypothetical protein [Anaerolineae bacterium]
MKLRVLLMILIVALAACTGGEPTAEVTAEPEAAAEEPAVVAPTQAVIVVTRDPNSSPFGSVQQSEEATEDPFPDALFDSIRIIRVGGGEGVEQIELDIRQDGTYVRNGVPGVITPEEVIEIDAQLDELQFFDMTGDMLGPGGDDRAFTYGITVERAGTRRTVQADDRYMPTILKEFVARILMIGL